MIRATVASSHCPHEQVSVGGLCCPPQLARGGLTEPRKEVGAEAHLEGQGTQGVLGTEACLAVLTKVPPQATAL
jgi:hypothetical protein